MKLNKTVLLLPLMMLGVACAKEIGQTETYDGPVTTISVGLPQATKTALADDNGVYKLVWSEGDALTVNGVESEPVPAQYVGQRNASFTFQAALSAPFNMLYAAKKGSEDVVEFPSPQIYVPGSFAQASAPMYAAGDDIDALAPQGLFSAIRFRISGTEKDSLKSVIVSSFGGENLSGEFKVDKSEGKFNGTLIPQNGASSVALAFEKPQALSSDGVDFILTVPAGSYAQGFHAYFVNTSGKTMEVRFLTGGAYTMLANKVYALEKTEFESNSSVYVILTVEDLIGLSAFAGEDLASTKAMLVADIDVTGSAFKTINNFYGSIDGLGNTISGLSTPLFGNFFGSACNLILNAAIEYNGEISESDAGADNSIGILCHTLNGRSGCKIDNVKTTGSIKWIAPTKVARPFCFGGIAGHSVDADFENCTNEAEVSVEGTTSIAKHESGAAINDLCVGGIVGWLDSLKTSPSIKNCHNKAAVSIKAGTFGDRAIVGGVAGSAFNALGQVSQCSNSGDVTAIEGVQIDSTVYFGGVVGTAFNTVSQSSNSGKVSLDAVIGGSTYVGGVLGNGKRTIDGFSKGVNVNNLTNEGTVKLLGKTAKGICLGGVCGIVGYAVNTAEYCCNKGEVLLYNNGSSTSYVGGVFGQSDTRTARNHSNEGTVLVGDKAVGSYIFAGGLFGTTSPENGEMYDCTTAQTSCVKYDGGTFTATTGIAVGGMIGKAGNFMTVRNVTNNGDVIVSNVKTTNSSKGRFDIGGIIGYIQITNGNTVANGVMTLDNVTNNGAVNFTTTPTAASYVRCGGLIGNAVSERKADGNYSFDETLKVRDCTNNGAIFFADITGSKNINAGGLIGHDWFTYYIENNCLNTGDITVNGSNVTGNALYQMNLGGHVGLISRSRWASADITGKGDTPANIGKIILNAQKTLPVHPTAGGIVGSAVGYNTTVTAGKVNELMFNIRDCVNAGEITSTLTGWTYNATDYKKFDYSGYCGGIIGRITGPWEKASSSSYTTCLATISNCTNKADLAWGKRGPSFTSSWSGSYNSSFTGGIIGLAQASRADYPLTINCCNNEGNILSYDGCCGGFIGYAHLYTSIIGTPENYCKNSGNICKGGFNLPQAYAGGFVGWVYTGAKQVFRYLENSGTVFANEGEGGFAGYLTDNQQWTLEYFKNKGNVESSTSTGKTGCIFGYSSSHPTSSSYYAWLDGMWLPGMNYIAIGGTVKAKNSVETTFVLQGTDSEAENYFLNHIGQYLDLDAKSYIYDPDTKKASTTEQATLRQLFNKHLGSESGKVCEYWDGVSPTSWEK